MVPLMEKEVVTEKQWLDHEEFLDILAVAQATPGLFALNMASHIGNKLKGVRGGIVASMGVAFPSIVIILLIAVLMIAVGISAVPNYARIVRGSVLSIRGMEYVEAARAVGSSDLRIILRHIIPNSMAPIIVQSTLGVASAILNAAGLSFIGLGIQPPNPEWGAMLSGGRQYIRDFPHLTLYPGLAIMLTILALNFLGDGLRDALDPKLKR